MDYSDSDSSDPLSPSSSNTPAQKEALPIVCRVKPTLWWIVLLGIPEAAFMFSGPFLPDSQHSGKNNWGLAFIGWPVGVIAAMGVLWMAFELRRGEIRADAMGLTWRRGFSGWKSARWNEITDFYQGPFSANNARPGSRIVETPMGKLELSSSYQGIEAIADMVLEKAVHLGNRGWEVKEMRPREEWSRTFAVWSREQKWTAPFMTIGMLILVSVLGSVLAAAVSKPRLLGFWLDVFPLLILFAAFAPIMCVSIWGVITLWRERRFAWNHRDETLIANAQGVVFSSLERSLKARWDEIQKVAFLATEKGVTPIQIETAQGNFIIWRGHDFDMWRRFELFLYQYAP